MPLAAYAWQEYYIALHLFSGHFDPKRITISVIIHEEDTEKVLETCFRQRKYFLLFSWARVQSEQTGFSV